MRKLRYMGGLMSFNNTGLLNVRVTMVSDEVSPGVVKVIAPWSEPFFTYAKESELFDKPADADAYTVKCLADEIMESRQRQARRENQIARALNLYADPGLANHYYETISPKG